MACRISKIWQAFWDWSWDELVSFDLPALFDFVYGQTGQKIDYVGHSLVRNLAYFHEKLLEILQKLILHFISERSEMHGSSKILEI